MTRMVACDHCEGTGKCGNCGGTGLAIGGPCEQCIAAPISWKAAHPVMQEMGCRTCDGSGRVPYERSEDYRRKERERAQAEAERRAPARRAEKEAEEKEKAARQAEEERRWEQHLAALSMAQWQRQQLAECAKRAWEAVVNPLKEAELAEWDAFREMALRKWGRSRNPKRAKAMKRIETRIKKRRAAAMRKAGLPSDFGDYRTSFLDEHLPNHHKETLTYARRGRSFHWSGDSDQSDAPRLPGLLDMGQSNKKLPWRYMLTIEIDGALDAIGPVWFVGYGDGGTLVFADEQDTETVVPVGRIAGLEKIDTPGDPGASD